MIQLSKTEHHQLQKLFLLADEALGENFIHIKFVTFWETLREDHGLAKLLLMVEEYVRNEGRDR